MKITPKLFAASVALFGLFAGTARSSAQPVITRADLFNQTGLYYRAYANHYNPMDITGGTAYIVPPNLIGDAGPDRFWDFSTGPTDKVLRFDYLDPSTIVQAADFPNATIAEQMTDERDESRQWLFFEQVPGVGRKVYGFYATNPLFTPSNVFIPPIVDFPDTIAFGQEWSTSTIYENTLSLSDPDPEEGGLFELAQRTTLSSTFKVDAHGTVILPDPIGTFGQALRINEQVTIDIAIDFGEGQFDHVETDYTRNYYWVMPGYGIVAQLNSTQASSPPAEKFSRAISFMRLFETNKKVDNTGGGCELPDPVSNFRIRVSNKLILLSWTKAVCATKYSVEYTTDMKTWTALGNPTENVFWQGENTANGKARFYRVVSLK